MQSSEYAKSTVLKNHINEIMTNIKDEDFSEAQLENLLSKILITVFNDGIISNMTERKRVSSESVKKKSKEITSFLPAHFKGTDVGKKLVKVIQDEILANTTDYVLNIGYEHVLEDAINKVLQVAYSVGITTGFEIASDPDMKSIYTANVERFMKSGMPGNN